MYQILLKARLIWCREYIFMAYTRLKWHSSAFRKSLEPFSCRITSKSGVMFEAKYVMLPISMKQPENRIKSFLRPAYERWNLSDCFRCYPRNFSSLLRMDSSHDAWSLNFFSHFLLARRGKVRRHDTSMRAWTPAEVTNRNRNLAFDFLEKVPKSATVLYFRYTNIK